MQSRKIPIEAGGKNSFIVILCKGTGQSFEFSSVQFSTFISEKNIREDKNIKEYITKNTKMFFRGRKNPICDCSRSNQMP